MRASKAFPFFYGKSIPINGQYYHDGSNSSWVELHIHKALSLGANKIIVIDSYTKFSPLIIRFWLLFKSHIFSR
jgi:predicted patatin/cPLA2 family phospholipase